MRHLEKIYSWKKIVYQYSSVNGYEHIALIS